MSAVFYIAVIVTIALVITNIAVVYLTYMSLKDDAHRDFHPPAESTPPTTTRAEQSG